MTHPPTQSKPNARNEIRALALLLPQFHPVAENNRWWGQGFTEWTNVTRSLPRFRNHDQPRLPADLGFYDLRLPETRDAQAALAREYGIHGFCYYHYWFNGRRILERPFNEVLESGEPDFPFCLCWANENWTRTWSGGDRDVLLEQHYSEADDRAHIAALLPALQDPRYIRVDGKPLLLVYRTELLPDPASTARIWRGAAQAAGLPGLYLVRVENFERDVDPTSVGFDAALEFAPDGREMGAKLYRSRLHRLLARLRLISAAPMENDVFAYPAVAAGKMQRPAPAFKRFHCVTPAWDNSARRKRNARILVNSTPSEYQRWLQHMAARTLDEFRGDERLLFINAWNEWAEGAYLEPDQRWGRAYLEATAHALKHPQRTDLSDPHTGASPFKALYWRLRERLGRLLP